MFGRRQRLHHRSLRRDRRDRPAPTRKCGDNLSRNCRPVRPRGGVHRGLGRLSPGRQEDGRHRLRRRRKRMHERPVRWGEQQLRTPERLRRLPGVREQRLLHARRLRRGDARVRANRRRLRRDTQLRIVPQQLSLQRRRAVRSESQLCQRRHRRRCLRVAGSGSDGPGARERVPLPQLQRLLPLISARTAGMLPSRPAARFLLRRPGLHALSVH